MPETQPGKPIPLASPEPPEERIAEWTEPNEKLLQLAQLSLPVVIGGTILLMIILIAVGIWQHDFTFYLGAVAILAGATAVISQRRKPAASREVILTNRRLQVGNRSYPLSDLAGFWLEQVGEVTAINVEPTKPAMLPINMLFPSADRSEARSVMLEVLPELEPRRTTTSDTLNRFMRL